MYEYNNAQRNDILLKARKYFLAYYLYQQFLQQKNAARFPSRFDIASFARQHAQAGTGLYKSIQSMCIPGRKLYIIVHHFEDQVQTMFKPSILQCNLKKISIKHIEQIFQ